MNMTLTQILGLVGKLDDTTGEDTPRERFRKFLKDNINEVGQIRDYIGECLRNAGEQYNRALQDLVDYIGHFLGFEVTFGRYHGVSGEIGFDGLWKSPTQFFIVVEVKTTEAYAIKTASLVGYVNDLISEQIIPNWDHALGLYVVGRPDPEISQLQNAIVAEGRNQHLRIISAEYLLSLAELFNEYDVSHDDILEVLKPSKPIIDPIVGTMARLVAQRQVREEPEEEVVKEEEAIEKGEERYWLAPVASDDVETAENTVKVLVGDEKIYAFGDRTPGRQHIKPGDWICFYATGNGVVAHAQVSSYPAYKLHPKIRHSDEYPWVFSVKEISLYLDKPIIIDAALRSQLDTFQGRDLNKGWAWFVQATRKITKKDFQLLTGSG